MDSETMDEQRPVSDTDVDADARDRLLGELELLRGCLLPPDETLTFVADAAAWERALNARTGLVTPPAADAPATELYSSSAGGAEFEVRVRGAPVWFVVAAGTSAPDVRVKGAQLGRAEQERWQDLVRERMHLEDVQSSEYPLYELFSAHLLPLLQDAAAAESITASPTSTERAPDAPGALGSGPRFHALLTSHHLVAPSKRRALAQWAGALALRGFAKLGHPGVLYAAGARADVHAFVARVKALQWLALRLRFLEPLDPGDGEGGEEEEGGSEWREYEKVGEVVEYMRRIGREKYVVEMGIGSAGAK